jgi:Cu-Zn family superoxide dismutase
MSASPEHEGDMPNQKADSKGKMKATILNRNISVASLLDADGTAIVIHAMPDDYMTQPTGNAGDRIACGIVAK